MSKSALVILGAGASHAALAPGQPPLRSDLRPPLTEHIFNSALCPVAEVHLNNFPGALNLAGTIWVKTRNDPTILETVLRDLRDSRQRPDPDYFPHIPLFFQELFGTISEGYVKIAGNYSHLARELLRGFERVAFVTLNYDRLLEKSLGTATWGGPFRSMNSYVRGRWLLVKLHGSVDWVRQLETEPDGHKQPGGVDGSRSRLLEIIDEQGVEYADSPARVVPTWSDWFVAIPPESTNFYPHYPVIVVPAKGKSRPLCPQAHLDALHEWATFCRNLLIIGASGRDEDLLEVLSHLPELEQAQIVGEPREAADRAALNFRQNAQIDATASSGRLTVHGAGFSDFLTEGGLDGFVSSATDD